MAKPARTQVPLGQPSGPLSKADTQQQSRSLALASAPNQVKRLCFFVTAENNAVVGFVLQEWQSGEGVHSPSSEGMTDRLSSIGNLLPPDSPDFTYQKRNETSRVTDSRVSSKRLGQTGNYSVLRALTFSHPNFNGHAGPCHDTPESG